MADAITILEGANERHRAHPFHQEVSRVKIDETVWKFYSEPGPHVRQAAEDALRRIGWPAEVISTRIARKRGDGLTSRGAINGKCLEIWCFTLSGFEGEIHVCYSSRDSTIPSEMADKLDAIFTAARDGHPVVINYEGLEKREALLEFEYFHAGHRVREWGEGEQIITHCDDCNQEFRES